MATLRITLWGTRGSVPSPGSATTRFGGNTSCVSVEVLGVPEVGAVGSAVGSAGGSAGGSVAGGAGGTLLVFDAGTGIRSLGAHLLRLGAAVRGTLFLTHFHWDHIQGLPYFAPLLREETVLTVRAPGTDGAEVRQRLDVQNSPPFSPVSLASFPCRVEFASLAEEGVWEEGVVRVRWFPVRHHAAVAFRIEAGNRSVVYAPDNELSGPDYGLGREWPRAFREFVAGADILIHDGMYRAEELEARRGWGHSSMEEAIRLAEEAGVARLVLYHHAPDRSDEELLALEVRLRGEVRLREEARTRSGAEGGSPTERGPPPDVGFAAEGEVFELSVEAAVRLPLGE